MDKKQLVSFGNYKWRVLKENKNKMLILSNDIIGQRDYHNKKEDVTWENSEIRKYLNGEFINTFSLVEQNMIIPDIIANNDNPWYSTCGGNDTRDYIFLLSLEETVRSFIGDSSRLLDNPKPNQRYWFERKDENNQNRRANYLESSWWWWTRTPGKNNKVAVYVHGDGNIGIQGNGISKTTFNTIHRITKSNKGGIRPAMWIRL